MDNASPWEQRHVSQEDQRKEPLNLLDENIVGLPSDRIPTHDQVLSVIRMLEDAELSSCSVEENALIYYGAGRVQNLDQCTAL